MGSIFFLDLFAWKFLCFESLIIRVLWWIIDVWKIWSATDLKVYMLWASIISKHFILLIVEHASHICSCQSERTKWCEKWCSALSGTFSTRTFIKSPLKWIEVYLFSHSTTHNETSINDVSDCDDSTVCD